jgi:quercetin dioxygenase-like cupin family protein
MDELFTGGQVWQRVLAGPATGAGKDMSISIVQFGAGARTRMHRHTGDQLLYVVGGIGKVGTASDEQVVSTGDFILIPSGEEHWHGAGDTGSPMSHITVMPAGSETSVAE